MGASVSYRHISSHRIFIKLGDYVDGLDVSVKFIIWPDSSKVVWIMALELSKISHLTGLLVAL